MLPAPLYANPQVLSGDTARLKRFSKVASVRGWATTKLLKAAKAPMRDAVLARMFPAQSIEIDMN